MPYSLLPDFFLSFLRHPKNYQVMLTRFWSASIPGMLGLDPDQELVGMTSNPEPTQY
jgi:hypothetical protein